MLASTYQERASLYARQTARDLAESRRDQTRSWLYGRVVATATACHCGGAGVEDMVCAGCGRLVTD